MTSGDQLSPTITGTRRAILEHLLDSDANAVQLAEKLHINISAVRNHLDVLELAGLVSSHRELAERGRPKRVYTLTPLAFTLFPQKSNQVATALFQVLNEALDVKTANALIHHSVQILWQQILLERPKGSLKARLGRVVQALDAYGCYASLDQDQGSFIIVIRNFVFREALHTAPIVIGDQFREEFMQQLAQMLGPAIVEWIIPEDPEDQILRVRVTPRRERK